MMPKALILSQDDQYHKPELLGSMIIDWLKEPKDIDIEVSHDKASLSKLSGFDLCIFYITPGEEFTGDDTKLLADFVKSGKKLLAIHSTTVINEKNSEYINLLGGRFITHSPYQEFPVTIVDTDHPVTKGIENFKISDELYVLDREPKDAHILASTTWENKVQPMVYVKEYGKGKVLYIALGHDEVAFNNPAFQKFIVNGIKWLAG